MKRKRLPTLVAMILTILFIFVLNPSVTWIAYVNYPLCDMRLHDLASEITKNSTNDTQVVYDIAWWVSNNVNWSAQFYCQRFLSDCETVYKQCGSCGGKADLVRSLLYTLGFNEATKGGTQGEDHEWNEVFVDGSWIALDASGDRYVLWNFSKRELEEIKGGGNGSLRRYSIIKKYYPNGTVVDVTNEYTDTGHVVLMVLDEYGKPIDSATATAKSHSLMESDPTFTAPKDSEHCITNSSGICELNLGGNNYTFAVSKYLFVYMNETESLVSENSNLEITITSKIDPEKAVLLFVIIAVTSVTILYIFIRFYVPMMRNCVVRKIQNISHSRILIQERKTIMLSES
ncbi:MAG: transglutaminase-like domain-containing protein [Candidatus Aenigmarchaeota archaeon]|nr:transglutaminase-like domain-containing protein [Candidatus Aenigmarchaeota archaeon]